MHVLMHCRRILLVLVFSACIFMAAAQQNLPPFNAAKVEKSLQDLSPQRQVMLLDSLSRKYAQRSPQEGVTVTTFAIQYIARHSLGEKRLAQLYLRRGQKYVALHKYALALNDLLRAEELYLKRDDMSGLQEVFSAFTNLYTLSGRNAKAIQYALRAKEYAEKLGEDESLGIAFNSLATLYKEQDMPDSALYYYHAALQLLRKHKKPVQEALLLDNISMLWASVGRSDSAAFYNARALQIAHVKKDAYLELQLMLNATSVLEQQARYDEQYAQSVRAKNLADSLGNDIYSIYTALNVGSALLNINRPAEAVPIFRSHIARVKAYGDNAGLVMLYGELGEAFEMMRMNDSALHYFKRYQAQKDTLEIIAAKDKVNELLADKQMEVQEQKIVYLHQINAATQEKSKLQAAIIWISVCLLVVIAVLLVITFARFRENKKLARLLEHKNTEITDSINYAQKIQFALLPGEAEFNAVWKKSFILFLPKDIVSGDFYWVARNGNLTFIAVGDCTGHGVPGGFMSMLGYSFLNEIILEKQVSDPGAVLDLLRTKVIATLKQTGATGQNKDGMDISLAVINEANAEITYAAANNALYFLSKGQLRELPPDKQPIGFYSEKMKPFNSHTLSYGPGDQLYLFTDGYADQFGGPKGKKLKYRQLKEYIVAGHTLLPGDQKNQLNNSFVNWKGSHDQVDDVCMVGIWL